MTLPIVYIHGAFSTGMSFQRIKENLPRHKLEIVEYSVDEPLVNVIDKVDAIIKKMGPVAIVAHSLGGIIAVSVASGNDNVKSIVTLSTPFLGSKAAATIIWFNPHELYRSMDPNSRVIRNIHSSKLNCRIRSIITTSGDNPMIPEPNDGVVTRSSQMALSSCEQILLPLNHFEVLLSDDTINLIKEFLFPNSKIK